MSCPKAATISHAVIARASRASCAVCGVDAAAHAPCSTCFVVGMPNADFVRRARGIKICSHCDRWHREKAVGVAWNADELVLGDDDDVTSSERRAAMPLRDAMKPERGRGRPRDARIDVEVLPLLLDREKLELVVRRPARRRTWSARARGRYTCACCGRRGHNRRSCNGDKRRARARRGSYARRGMTSRREIARLAGCDHMSVNLRFHELFRANFARPPTK